MKAKELFQNGALDEAIAAAVEEVKARPSDPRLRSFLAELLAFASDFERADKQLDALGTMHVDFALGVVLFRQLLRAERWRSQCFQEGRVPEFISQPTEELQRRLRALVALREESFDEALATLNEAESLRQRRDGTANGQAFSDCRDLDDLLGSIVEVLTSNGTYYWVPMERIEFIEFHPVKHARDQLWRGARIEVDGKIEGEVYVPVLYPGSVQNADPRVRLGRTTDWTSPCEGIVRGQGQKMWLFGDDAVPLLQVGTIDFPVTGSASAGEPDKPDEPDERDDSE